MKPISPAQLRKLFPGLTREKSELFAPHFSAAVEEAKINTRVRLCAFVAQLAHESKNLKFLKEIWGNTPAQLRYDVRADLGNTPERDGDGKKFMGRGGIQRTGKANYLRFKEATGVDVIAHPELLEKPEYAFRSDALYWTDKKLNKLADKLTLRGDAKDLDTFDRITKIVNGGYNGRVDRQSHYIVAIATLPDELFEASDSPAHRTNPTSDETKPTEAGTIVTNGETKFPSGETNSTSDVLMAKLSANEGVKTAGGRLAKRIGFQLSAPFGVLLGLLQAGNVFAWIGVAIFVIATGLIIFKFRHDLSALIKHQVKRINP